MINPKIEILTRKAIDFSLYKEKHATEEDYDTLITEPTVIYEPNSEEPKIVYLTLDDDCSEILEALNKIKYGSDYRTDGMMTQSRTIGYSPRVTIRRDFCTSSSASTEYPIEHNLIASYASKVAHYYRYFAPMLYEKHQDLTDKVLDNWKIDESVFTSGIINKNNPLPYHHDRGNFKDVWSNMLVFKKDVVGGYLSVPEYNVGFQLQNNSLLMFDGQNLLHGVTPIIQLSDTSYRYSIVYYSLLQMWKCLPPKEEVLRIRNIRDDREERRLHGQTGSKKKK